RLDRTMTPNRSGLLTEAGWPSSDTKAVGPWYFSSPYPPGRSHRPVCPGSHLTGSTHRQPPN
ncbi:uncharacterized protein METZ01_LOCUS191392, partial [marine metagenome]